jgi:DNA-binding MarR family transcriptional regulator
MEITTSDPFQSLIFLTNRVGRLLVKHVRDRYPDGNEMPATPHMGILVDLWMQDGVRQQDLAISLIKDKATIARAINSLEKSGLVDRIADEQDKRTKRIHLTSRGKALKGRLWPLTEKVVEEALIDIPEEEAGICRRVLVKMFQNLNRDQLVSAKTGQ